MSDKQIILDIVKNIDEDKSFEEILYALYLELELRKGISDFETGNTKTTQQVKEIVDNC